MANITFVKMAPRYSEMLSKVQVTRKQTADQAAVRILANKKRYQKASELCGGVPWEFIAVTHLRESNLDFTKNLHNGEPLTVRTRLEPKRRGPFATWEDSAVDALCTLKGLDKIEDWSDERMLYELERYNGFGYANKGKPSPYLWAGTNQYSRGKFIADHKYDPNHVDTQLGCWSVIARIRELEGGAGLKKSKKYRFFKRLQAWFLSLVPAGGVAEYMGWIDTVANWTWNYRYYVLAGIVLGGYGLFKWLQVETAKDYAEGRFLPSGEKVEDDELVE